MCVLPCNNRHDAELTCRVNIDTSKRVTVRMCIAAATAVYGQLEGSGVSTLHQVGGGYKYNFLLTLVNSEQRDDGYFVYKSCEGHIMVML